MTPLSYPEKILFQNTTFTLSIHYRQEEALIQLAVHGRFTHENVYIFRKYLSQIFENEMSQYQILRLDFSKIKLIDSMSFGVLQDLYFLLHQQGKALQLVHLPKNMENLIRNSHFKHCLLSSP